MSAITEEIDEEATAINRHSQAHDVFYSATPEEQDHYLAVAEDHERWRWAEELEYMSFDDESIGRR